MESDADLVNKWEVDLVGMKDGHVRAVVVKMNEAFSKFESSTNYKCVRIQLSDGGKEKKKISSLVYVDKALYMIIVLNEWTRKTGTIVFALE